MSTRALYRSVTCNVYTSDPIKQQSGTIREAWGRADVLKLNEGHDAAGIIRGLRGARWYRPEGSVGSNNPIIWRDSEFSLITRGSKTVYVGGKGDGPSRGVVWVLLEHRATKQRVIEANVHMIHKAWTSVPSRKPIWNQILADVSEVMQNLRDRYPSTPIVISGDMNKPDADGPINWPGFPGLDDVTSTPNTYGSNRYDRFFIDGPIAAKSNAAFTTNSDHKAVVVNFQLTQVVAGPTAPTPSPTKANDGDTATPPNIPVQQPPGVLDLRRRATWQADKRWRFFAMRMDGTGGDGEIIHPELPLTDPEIEDVLSGHNGLSGKISPEFGSLIADDGRLLLEEWGTAIWAEESGNVVGGGIVTHSGFVRSEWSIECVGLTGYAQELPYASERFFVEEDPLNIFRHIWAHIQAQPGGNVGLQVDSLLTGLQVGVELEQVEFDTQSGPISFESGPYKLNWYSDHDLDEKLGSLSADTPFDWHETHFWEGEILRHYLKLGYPNLGVRRNDLRFVIGENVAVVPDLDRNGEDYADEVWALGAGEGSTMKRGTARRDINRLRRVAVVADPSLRTQNAVNARAAREIAWRNNLDNVSQIVVRDHPHADIASVQVGDEIHIEGPTGWVDIDAYYRVTGRTIKPFDPGRMLLTVTRADRIAA